MNGNCFMTEAILCLSFVKFVKVKKGMRSLLLEKAIKVLSPKRIFSL